MPAATLILVGPNISGAGFLRHLAWIFYNTNGHKKMRASNFRLALS